MTPIIYCTIAIDSSTIRILREVVSYAKVAEENFRLDWTRSIDQYCERTDASFFSEPLNFATNLAFALASYMLWRQIRNVPSHRRQPGSLFLGINMMVIAIGSAMFHSIATVWAMAADVLPIGVFLLGYLFCFLRWQAGLSPKGVTIGLLIFGALTAMTAALANHDLANGSQMYFGAWMSLFGIACYLLGKPGVKERWLVPTAAVALTISLLLRTIDMRVCDAWPYGTHFGWHTLNGLVLYLLGRSYITSPRQLSL